MNIHDPKITTPKVTTGALPGSRKVFSVPESAPDLRVPLREIALDPSANEPPLPVYDTTGPYTDPDVSIDVEKGLSRARIELGARARRRRGISRPPAPADRQRQCVGQASRPRISRRSTSRCARSTASR